MNESPEKRGGVTLIVPTAVPVGPVGTSNVPKNEGPYIFFGSSTPTPKSSEASTEAALPPIDPPPLTKACVYGLSESRLMASPEVMLPDKPEAPPSTETATINESKLLLACSIKV